MCATLERSLGSASQENKHQNKPTQGRVIKLTGSNAESQVPQEKRSVFCPVGSHGRSPCRMHNLKLEYKVA